MAEETKSPEATVDQTTINPEEQPEKNPEEQPEKNPEEEKEKNPEEEKEKNPEEKPEGEKEKSIFDLDFEDELKPDIKNVGGYDLTKYQERFEKLPEEDKTALTEELKQYKENGFTDKQIDYLLQKAVSEEKEQPTKDINYYKERLSKELSPEEKKNFTEIKSFVKNSFQGTDLEKYSGEIIKNPVLVKMFNVLLNSKQLSGNTTNLNTFNYKKDPPRTTEDLNFSEATNKLNDLIYKGKATEEAINLLYQRVDDKENFNEVLRGIGKSVKK